MSEKRFAIQTLGCKLNFSESATISRKLVQEGFRRVGFKEFAEVYIIDTCSVTSVAEKKSRYAIRQASALNSKALILVTGCSANLNREELATIEGVDGVWSNENKGELISYVLDQKIEQVGEEKKSPDFFQAYSLNDRTRSFLKVQDGCNYHCTYCSIPQSRGKSRSTTIKDVVQSARTIGQAGIREIVLTGINVGDFGRGRKESFAELIEALDKVEEVDRFRISSIEPNLLTDDMISFVAQSSKFMPHFHIPLQSGSDEVLKLMRRKYDTSLFYDKVHYIRQTMPHAFIGVDVIVGSNGETEEKFIESCEFINSIPVSDLHVFTYSERPGTAALDIPHTVLPGDRAKRSHHLQTVAKEMKKAFYQKFSSSKATVLFEKKERDGICRGFTENYIRVGVPVQQSLQNQLINVKLGEWNQELELLDAVITH